MSHPPALSRRAFLHISSIAVAGVTVAACASTTLPSAQPTIGAEAPVTNPDQALQRLMEGNQRYVTNTTLPVNESERRRMDVAKGQQPFATIFSCVDSRVPPELVFDRGLGDLFVIRTAGHVIDNAVLGSLEFGVAELHIPVLMVLGHEKCGAVQATIEAVEKNAHAEADINWLVEGIRPAVEQAKTHSGDLLDNAVKANVELTIQRLKSSPILSEAIQKGELKIVGARYDLDTGSVELVVS
jgi:carbonic anhydrase